METNVSKKGTPTNPQAEVKTAPMKVVTENPKEPKQEKPISADERILKADNFKIITDRYQILKQRQDDLTKLLLSKDGSRETLLISNQNGKRYEVTNSQVINDVVALLKTKGEAALAETAAEIVGFTI